MKKILLGLLLYWMTGSVFAEAIMIITPDSMADLFITRSGGTQNVLFNVFNNTSKTLTDLTIDPDFGISSGASTITVTTPNTCNVSLTPGGTCQFNVQIAGNTSLPDHFFLSPRVCAYNNTICSQPVKTNRPEVIIVRQAYVANTAGNSISVCAIDSSTNQIMSCLDATMTTTGDPLDGPMGLMMTADGKRVYVANSGNGTISLCTVDPLANDGSFSTCASTGITFANPNDIELNPAETFAYVASTGASLVVVCTVDATTGELSDCTSTGSGFVVPTSIVFNNAGTLAYITNQNNNTVSVCTANVNTGLLSGCETTGSTFSFPQGIDLSNNNSFAYVTNYLSNQLSVCNIPNLATGLFGTCTLSNQGIFNPFGLVINPNGNILYITQPSSNSIYKCNVSNSTLSSCAVTFAGAPLSSPSGIVLN